MSFCAVFEALVASTFASASGLRIAMAFCKDIALPSDGPAQESETGAGFSPVTSHFKQEKSILRLRLARSVEMHILSKQRQSVRIPDCDLSVGFVEGETIWTESSHKYSYLEIFQIAEAAGFSCKAQWVDHDWPFAESLLVAE